MTRRIITKDFIKRAREVHGDRYDYSKVVYVAAREKVIITCPTHGDFSQTPANHTTGRGCRECGGNNPLTKERFVERANIIHNNFYDYSLVHFKNVESKIEIICPDHGSFHQRVMNHLKGFNCPKCGRESTADKLSHSLEKFLEESRNSHSDKYDYSQVNYINAHTNVTIICPTHGSFEQKPAHHVRDIGCPKCGDESMAEKRASTTEEFIGLAKEAHGEKYDYSKSLYKNAKIKVEIICKEHGSFWQLPFSHTHGLQSGCPGCALSGFDQTKPGLLYYLAIKTKENETLYKIGITNLSVKRRFSNIDLAKIRVVKTWSFEVGRDAADREAVILKEYSKDKYLGPPVLEGAGNTELFTRDILGIDNKENEEIGSTINDDATLINKPTQLKLKI